MMLFTPSEKKPKIVIDTNILVSAGLGKLGYSHQIVLRIAKGIVQNFTSEALLIEVYSVFERKEITERISKVDRNFLLAVYEQKSVKVKPVIFSEKISADPDDDKLFCCALAAKAGFIVSGDLQVLKVKEFQKIRVLSPKEFLLWFQRDKGLITD